jgi:YHS domain-containing protein/limonene-1,2-epoxide hydrolase
MANPRQVVECYLTALYNGKADEARRHLADELSFRGPGAAITGADNVLKASEHAVRAVKRLEIHKVFVDGSEVAAFYDLQIDHPIGTITLADWYQVEDDHICSIRTILDTGPLSSGGGETAVDPVCGMTVSKSAAAATRMYASQSYYFCNPGCANAFDLEPDKYASRVAA